MKLPMFVLLALSLICGAANAEEHFSFGRFGTVNVYRPTHRAANGSSEVVHAAIVFSDLHGWDENATAVAKSLADTGVLVAGVDLAHYANELAKPRDKCSYLAGEFEDFSHELQKKYSPQRYHLPVLVGLGEGGALVYAIAAQGSPGTFAAALTLGFCPTLSIRINLCHSYELQYDRKTLDEPMHLKPSEGLSTPWTALHGNNDAVCSATTIRQFVTKVGTAASVVIPGMAHEFNNPTYWRKPFLAAFDQLAKVDSAPVAVAEDLRDLPLEEVKASANATHRFVVFVTGDGGWADLDKKVSAQLAKQGNSVVALNSLQYFWKGRTPEQAAADVARIMRHYLAAWNKDEVILIGYSFGADSLPFITNLLPNDLKAKIRTLNLLGLASNADFEVHVTNWIGVDHHGPATQPEVERVPMPLLCIYGEGEKDTVCRQLKNANLRTVMIGDGHHFGGKYEALAKEILDFADRPDASKK